MSGSDFASQARRLSNRLLMLLMLNVATLNYRQLTMQTVAQRKARSEGERYEPLTGLWAKTQQRCCEETVTG